MEEWLGLLIRVVIIIVVGFAVAWLIVTIGDLISEELKDQPDIVFVIGVVIGIWVGAVTQGLVARDERNRYIL